jgi:predicted acylesterase/phospholipase RssA
MGGCIAALAALEYDYDEMLRYTVGTFITPRPFKKYTLPLYSLLRNGVFDRSAAWTYGPDGVEDCWTNCFLVASNLSTAETLVLERGPLAESVLSSMALPGTVAPRIRDGHLIADGAILNNLPVDVMRERAHRVVAVDVGGGKKALRVRFEQFPSPWQVFWRRISPFHSTVRVPNLMEIMLRSALLASTQREKEVESQCDLYLTPPMKGFALLPMDRLEEIVEVGYRYGLEKLSSARAELTEPGSASCL